MKRPAVVRNRSWDTWLVQPVLCHWATTTGQPPAPTIFYIYYTGCTEVPQSHTQQPLGTLGDETPWFVATVLTSTKGVRAVGTLPLIGLQPPSMWGTADVWCRRYPSLTTLTKLMTISGGQFWCPYNEDCTKNSRCTETGWQDHSSHINFFILSLRHVHRNVWKDNNYAPHNFHSQL